MVYLPTLRNGFVWDDEELIVKNSAITTLSNLPAFFSGSTFNSGGATQLSGLYYKPLMTTTFALLYQFFGANPFYFHLFQIIIHLLNAVLVYLILSCLFKKIALPVALLFLVHPINAEAVVYVADLQDVLFFFFGALTFWLILSGKNVFFSTLPLLLSLLSKETGVVFTAIIFVYLLMFDRPKLKQFLFSLVLVGGIYAYLRFFVAGIFFNKHGLTPITTMGLPHRLINIPQIIFTYFSNFFLPVNLAINQQWVVRTIDLRIMILDLGILGGLVMLGTKSQLGCFFLIWFLLGLIFHLQIFPLDLTVSDRWFYLPVVGLISVVMLNLFQHLSQTSRSRNKFGMIIIIGVLMVFSLRTMVRITDWHDGYTLYSHDIKISPNAFDLENNLGVELFRKGDFQQAKIHFEKSTKLSPKWWTNWNNLGAVLEREGNLEKAKGCYKKAMDNGQYYLAFENYAGILLKQQKYPALKSFLEDEALPRFPNNEKLREIYNNF